MQSYIDAFITYLHNVKKMSENTELSYKRDLSKVCRYMEDQGIHNPADITATNLNSYVLYLEKNKFSAATISRNIACIKTFYHYLYKEGKVKVDASEGLKAPKVEKKIPEILTTSEVVRLLEQPQGTNPKDVRDKAMLELLYATGIKVSELICLNIGDADTRSGLLLCSSGGKERYIPMGREAETALKDYINKARPLMASDPGEKTLFINCYGKKLTRQGFWKILRSYAESAGIKSEINAQTLRHSFALHLLQNGADIDAVSEMLGHSYISTTKRYDRVLKENIK